MTLLVGHVFAQDAFPAPLPGQAVAPASNALPFPTVNGMGLSLGGPSDACMTGLVLLRKEADMRGKLIKAASERHAPQDEACQLIGNFSHSEIKLIKYLEVNSANCGISPWIGDRLKAGHKNTEAMQTKICTAAQQARTRGSDGPGLHDVLGAPRRGPPGLVGGFDRVR